MKFFEWLKLVFAISLSVSCGNGLNESGNSVSMNDAAGNRYVADNQVKSGRTMANVISADGTKIAYEKTGSGPSLILVSGALTERSLLKGEAGTLIEMLSEHFTVYTYDRRGRGESTNVLPYAVERETEDLEALIDQAAGGKVCLYGVSSGGALALRTTSVSGPGKVIRLAVYEPPYGQGKEAFDRQKLGVNERVKNGQPGDAATFFLSEIGTPPQVLEGMKSSPEWEIFKRIDYTLVYDYEILGDGAIPVAIARAITVPALVMNGEKSLEFMEATARQLARDIPQAEHKVLKGQMHQAKAEVMAPVLIDFFKGKTTSK